MFRSLALSCPDRVVVADSDGVVIWAAAAARRHLKIDGSFVSAIHHGQASRVIAQSIVSLADADRRGRGDARAARCSA